jgi:tyrosine-protein phosphatase SIW14
MHVLRRRSSTAAAALLLAFSVAIPAAAKAERAAGVAIDNFGRVNTGYFRGAQPQGNDYEDLAAFGIRTIIDLTKDGDLAEASIVEDLGMKFYRIPMTTRQTPSDAEIARFLKIVGDPANPPVYVHCQGGRHRTGVMTAVYRMTNDGWNADRAFAEMKQYKFGADFLHPEFKRFVYAYHPESSRTVARVGSATSAVAAK